MKKKSRLLDNEKLSAALFRSFAENTRDAVYLISIPEGVIEYVNSAAVALTGYPADAFQTITDIISVLIPPDWQALMQKAWQGLQAGKPSEWQEHPLLHKSGETLWVMHRIFILNDDSGNPVGMQGIISDATLRKRQEEALQERENRYRILTNLVSDYAISYRVEEDGTFIQENIDGAYEQLSGLSQEEIEERGNWMDNILPEDLSKVVTWTEKLIKSAQPSSLVYRVLAREDEVRWLQAFAYPYYDEEKGRVVRLLGAARDISQQMESNYALQKSEERIRSLLETIPQGVYETDPNGIITATNLGLANITGYSQQELIGMSVIDLMAPSPEKDTFAGYWQYLIKEQPEPNAYKAYCLTKDKRHVYTQIDWTYRRDDSGQVNGFVCVLTDIQEEETARQDLEHRLATEELIAQISTNFFNLDKNQVDEEIISTLQAVAVFGGFSGIFLGIFSDDGQVLLNGYWWKEGGGDKVANYNLGVFQWLSNQMQDTKVIIIDSPKAMQRAVPAMSADHWKMQNYSSVVLIPIIMDGELLGVVGCGSEDETQRWEQEEIRLLRLTGEMLINFLTRQKTEAALQKSEKRYRDLFNSVPTAIFQTSFNGTILSANPMLLNVFHIPDIETALRTNAMSLYKDSEKRRLLLERLEKETTIQNAEIEFRRYDGTEFWGNVSLQVIQGDSEEGVYLEGSVQDISERKQNEARLHKQIKQLGVLNLGAAAGAEATQEAYLIYDVVQLVSNTLYPESDFSLMILPEEEDLQQENKVFRYSLQENGIPLVLKPEMDVINRVLRTGKPCVLSDMQQNTEAARSEICVPLKLGEKLLGVIDVKCQMPNSYNEEDERLLMALAGQMATAIAKVRLFVQTRQRAEYLEKLSKVTSVLRQATTTREIAAILVRSSADILNINSVALALLQEGDLLFAGTHGPAECLTDKKYPLQDTGPFYEAASKLETLYYGPGQNPADNQAYAWVSEGMHYNYIFPLQTAERVVGLLYTGFGNSQKPSDEAYNLLTAVAEVASNALHRAGITETLEQRVVERTRHLFILYEISEIASNLIALPFLLERMLEKIVDSTQNLAGGVFELEEVDGEEHSCLIAESGLTDAVKKQIENLLDEIDFQSWQNTTEPVIRSDFKQGVEQAQIFPQNWNVLIAVPVRVIGHKQGVLVVFGESIDDYSAEDLGLLSAIADQMGRTVENDQLRMQAEEIAVIEERQRLGRELHDSVTQSLYSTNLMVKATHRLAESGNWERAAHYLEEIGETIQQSLKEMRLLVHELRPLALQNNGLGEALHQRLEAVERRAGIEAFLLDEAQPDLSPQQEEALYRIAVEALNNILKHANASQVTVQLSQQEDKVLLQIIDNGRGFSVEDSASSGGIGLKSMQERITRLGGSLEIESQPDQGTSISVLL